MTLAEFYDAVLVESTVQKVFHIGATPPFVFHNQ
jgi:hypothetical protein